MVKNSMAESVVRGAEFMAIAARTAPKTRGDDFVGIKVISGEDVNKLADAMIQLGQENKQPKWNRDGENVKKSSAILLLSLEDPKPVGLNCGACGYSRCADLKTVEGPEFSGPLCAWRLLDLGIAMGSAVKTASIFNLDNRIMYRVGSIAKKLGMMEGPMVIGIPVSAEGKNIYFDRKI